MISTTENPTTTLPTLTTLLATEEDRKRSKKRRRQKSEKQKVDESQVSDERDEALGFEPISSENLHGPGYATFEKKLETENGAEFVRKFCSNLFLSAAVVILFR